MVEKQSCDAEFSFKGNILPCYLDKRHKGDHVSYGCGNTKEQTWEFTWRQDQSGLKVESENEL